MLKKERLSKIIKSQTGRTVIIPMDHGVTDGPMPGLVDMAQTLSKVKQGGGDAVIIHKGIVKQNREALDGLPYLIHISGSSSLGVPLRKVLVADVKESVELGATGVSIHVNLGNKYEPYMMEDLGRIARDCERERMPLLAMMYVRDQKNGEIINDTSVKSVAHAARLAYELGADIVKVNYTGDSEKFKQVIDGCKIPVVIAGGSKQALPEFIEMIKAAMSAGAAGVSCGRNVFQSDDVAETIKQICKVVHNLS
ncbi:MAG: 2-amino-3,7-dideoxy-D-threo-hept-6-ulosonate synthase [Candidatus Jacksonbacteria bacterium]